MDQDEDRLDDVKVTVPICHRTVEQCLGMRMQHGVDLWPEEFCSGGQYGGEQDWRGMPQKVHRVDYDVSRGGRASLTFGIQKSEYRVEVLIIAGVRAAPLDASTF